MPPPRLGSIHTDIVLAHEAPKSIVKSPMQMKIAHINNDLKIYLYYHFAAKLTPKQRKVERDLYTIKCMCIRPQYKSIILYIFP